MYDLVIVGCGPSGLTASIYASCFKLNHIVIGSVLGGQMSLAPDIINYPGFEEISGKELAEKMAAQVKKRGAEILSESVSKIERAANNFKVITESGKNFDCLTLIIATGAERRKLNIPGENEYIGKGVQYCATCEKFEYENKNVAVIGGANSAVQAVIQLSQAASKIYLIYRGSELRSDPVLIEKIKNDPKIEILYNAQVLEILGDGQKITGIKIKSNETEKTLDVEKVFIEIGGVPGSALAVPLGINVDEKGYIKVDDKLATNIPGAFAAGDIVSVGLSIEQISTAIGLGARASFSAFSYLKQQNAPSLWGQNQIKR
ncbi:MAG: FAD-dependent oxidoreductase [Patescibacteria group bacterium]|nr:FAD-dependent oxidoreductase [Patescibacteria group bacterium]